jgi:enoyl-CoA hydratase/carnithine racemase
MAAIRTERRGAVLEIVLDRQKQRNAMSSELVAELIDAVSAAAEDVGVGAILLAGAGNGFCAGSDLRELATMDDAGRSRFEAESGRSARLLTDGPKPVIAAVHGFAIGGGMTLAITADIVVTTADARWSLPEAPIGLFPAWGLEPLVARAGAAVARRLSFGIDTIDGCEAQRLGIADLIAEDAFNTARDVADRLAALPAASRAAVKAYFARPREGELGDASANRLFMETCASEAAQATFARFAAPPTS